MFYEKKTMEKEFIELDKINMTSTKELISFPICIRKTSITGFELVGIDSGDYTISYEMRDLFNKQIIENMRNPVEDKRSYIKSIICIHIGEKYFFVYESFARIAESLGGVDE